MRNESTFESCTQLTHQFFHHLDERRYDDMLEMMLPDAVWHRQGRALRGHEAIRTALGERSASQRIRHVITNGFIASTHGDEARFLAYMIGYRYDDGTVRQPPLTIAGPLRMLLVDATFVRAADGCWRIGQLAATPEFEFATPALS